MPKITLKDPGAQFRSVQQIKSNNDAIVVAVENTLSRDGTSPNHMEAVLDMNSNRIINLPEPASDNDPVRRIDIDSGIGADIQVVASIQDEVVAVAGNSADIQVVAADLSGPNTIGDAATLLAVPSPGLVAKDSSGSPTSVELIADPSNGLTVTNGDGASGDPTLSLAQDIRPTASPTFAGLNVTGVDTNVINGVAFAPSGGVVGQALGFPNFGNLLEPYTPAGAGDVLAAANNTFTGDNEFAGELRISGVTTLANLKAIDVTSITSGTRIITACRDTVSDLGGGVWVWRATDLSALVASDVRSGISAAPDSDSTGASGAWMRQYTGPMNVRWFGVSTSSSANNSAAINDMVKLVTESASLSPRAFFWPRGTYRFADPLDIFSSTIFLTQNLVWQGESGKYGDATRLLYNGGSNSYAISVRGWQVATFKDIAFAVDSVVENDDLDVFMDMDAGLVLGGSGGKRVTQAQVRLDGVTLSSDATFGEAAIWAKNQKLLSLDRVWLRVPSTGVRIGDDPANHTDTFYEGLCENTEIKNSYFLNCGIDLRYSLAADIRSNHFDGTDGPGARIFSTGVQFSGSAYIGLNTFLPNASEATYEPIVQGNGGPSTVDGRGGHYWEVENNFIRNPSVGIRLFGPARVGGNQFVLTAAGASSKSSVTGIVVESSALGLVQIDANDFANFTPNGGVPVVDNRTFPPASFAATPAPMQIYGQLNTADFTLPSIGSVATAVQVTNARFRGGLARVTYAVTIDSRDDGSRFWVRIARGSPAVNIQGTGSYAFIDDGERKTIYFSRILNLPASSENETFRLWVRQDGGAVTGIVRRDGLDAGSAESSTFFMIEPL